MNEWREFTIEQIKAKTSASIAMGPFGSNIKTENFVDFGVPIIQGRNLTDGFIDNNFVFLTEEKANELKTSNAFPNDIVITHRGTLGQVGIIPQNARFKRYVISQSQMKLTCDPELAYPLFIYYFFKSPTGQHQLLMNSNQTGVPAIAQPLKSLKQIKVFLPPLFEQQRIAHILGSLDDKIEANRQQNITLEEIARAIFKSWFVDFDPVHAKARGEMPYGMDAETADLFPGSFEKSKLGLIPRGWHVGTFGELGDFNTWTLSKQDSLDFIDYIEISSVNQGEIRQIQKYKRGEEPSRAKRRLRHGDTIISTVRPERKSYFLSLNPSPSLIVSTGFAVFTPNVGWAFTHLSLTRNEMFKRFGDLADGAAYPAISPGIIASQKVIIPSKEIIDCFHKRCVALLEKLEKNFNEIRTLTEIRDSLLPKLISGEIQLEGLYEKI